MTRLPPHLRNEDDEGETYQSIQQNTLPDSGGRFAGYGEPNNIGQTNNYPKLHGSSPLVTPQPDFGFDPSRDRIEPQDVTDWKFNYDMTKLNGQPSELEPPSANSAPDSPQEQIERVEGGSSFPRGITKVGHLWRVTVGRGMHSEVIGEFTSLEGAIAALADAQAARKD